MGRTWWIKRGVPSEGTSWSPSLPFPPTGGPKPPVTQQVSQVRAAVGRCQHLSLPSVALPPRDASETPMQHLRPQLLCRGASGAWENRTCLTEEVWVKQAKRSKSVQPAKCHLSHGEHVPSTLPPRGVLLLPPPWELLLRRRWAVAFRPPRTAPAP